MRGGKRPNSGRKPGAKNRVTKEREAAVAEAAKAIGAKVPNAFEGDAHAFLMFVYKNPLYKLETRLDAAGKAIRFERPALASSTEVNMPFDVTKLTDEQLDFLENIYRGQLVLPGAGSDRDRVAPKPSTSRARNRGTQH